MQFDASQLRSSGAHAEWTTSTPTWAYALADIGPWILAVVAGIALARALLQTRRYRALAVFDATRQSATHAALIAAEARTTGEIVPVVLERSDRYPGANWLSALVALILGTLLLAPHLPWGAPYELLCWQLGMAAVGFLLALVVPGWKRMFIGEARASEMAEEQAINEFHRLGLSQTSARTGVLLFVSLLERRVVVLGDAGIHAKVGDAHWDTTRSAIIDGVRKGCVDEGLIDGIRLCGAVLEQHFPWEHGDRNELPDRIVVRRE
ncbi:MAG: TPM domain-containing protein [Planctomycetes bacterium]|nr:TPM domain-containing protein [Planctomycetota bacterium]